MEKISNHYPDPRGRSEFESLPTMPNRRQRDNGLRRGCRAAFTLAELLMVIAIMMLLLTLLAPAIPNLARAGNVTYASSVFEGILDSARATAIAQRSYVWLGFSSFPADKPDQLALALYISKDGTPTRTADNLRLLDRIQVLNRIVLVQDLPDFGSRPRSNPDGSAIHQLSESYGVPLSQNVPGYGTQNFFCLLEFSPDGSVMANGQIHRCTEIGIAQSTDHAKANASAFQINGLTGRSHVYRP